ncbi:hypothetical protein F5B21DRAFT_517035 [Xylaria acuta]|nr:hypothetical protein F5B21DRAFT_517035 [Xylaria acuta]
MSGFRPILPSPQTASNIGGGGSSDGLSGKKRDAVSQEDRQLTVQKCDGGRPHCRTCLSKKRQCIYDSEDGRSTVTALRSRIEVLEQQVGQSQSARQAGASRTRSQFQSGLDSVPSATSADQPPCIISQRFLPSISVTRQAVDGFFSSSGKLFHIFTRAQVCAFLDSVWKDVDLENQSWKADVCCLMAIAAVGIQYTDTTGDADVSDTFYDICKVHLDSVLETRPLDAIKICTLLCMYNVTNKAVASLSYADIGLALCRRFGLYSRRRQLPSLTDSMWVDYRRASRTLVFLSTWLSATLGYRSSNQYLFERISPSDLNVDEASDISEVVQSEMARIAVLNIKILYMHIVHQDLGWAISAIAQDLEEWYDGLPQVMHLQEVSGQDLPQDVRRSIYLAHLIYLGTNILLFRRIAFEAVRSSKTKGVLPAPWQPSREQYLKQADEASLAANGSARIIKIMMNENCVFKRCWIIIFQSYTSCLIILHVVLGKIVLKTQPFDYEEDLENIRSCLSALSFCGSLNQVAARFHETLLSIYDSLINGHVNKPPASHPDADIGYRQPFTMEANVAVSTALGSGPQEDLCVDSSRYVDQSLEELSTDLLSMLCRPFGDPINRKESKECPDIGYRTAPSRKEHQCLMEKLDWDFEDSSPFQRDTTKVGISDDQNPQLNRNCANPGDFGLLGDGPDAPVQHRFIGSSGPNVWTSADYLQVNPWCFLRGSY